MSAADAGKKEGEKSKKQTVTELPNATVARVIKKALPQNALLGKDARLAFTRAASTWVIYLTNAANEFAKSNSKKGKKSTITATDVLAAVEELEFNEFVEPLQSFLKDYQEAQKKGKKAKEKRKAAEPAPSTSSSSSKPDKADAPKKKQKTNSGAANPSTSSKDKSEKEKGNDKESSSSSSSSKPKAKEKKKDEEKGTDGDGDVDMDSKSSSGSKKQSAKAPEHDKTEEASEKPVGKAAEKSSDSSKGDAAMEDA